METNEVGSTDQKPDVKITECFPVVVPLPPGALEDIYDREYIWLDNILAKASVTTLDPHDDPDNEC